MGLDERVVEFFQTSLKARNKCKVLVGGGAGYILARTW